MVDSGISIWRVGLSTLIIGAALSTLGHRLSAQPYKEVSKAITDPRQVAQLRREVSTIVRAGGGLSEADQRTLQNYYVMHVIAGMTQNNAASDPQQFPNWRKSVIGDLNSLGSSPQKHTFVRNLIYSYAGRLVQDRAYSPAARYNALLMIGELNEREAQGAGRSVTPAVPYTAARQFLLNVLRGDDGQEMQVGALIGLARHARLLAAAGANPDPNLLRAFVDVLQQNEPAAGESADGLTWMHRIAIDALGDIGEPGAARILEPILSDDNAPMVLRCAAADALGRLDYRNAANLDEAALLKGLGQVAASALATEIRNLQEHIQANPDEGFAAERMRRSSEELPEDPYVQRVRRQLKYQLICVGRGLRALQSVTADAATKNAMTALQSEIAAILKELDSENLMPQELFDKIGPPALKLENAIKNA